MSIRLSRAEYTLMPWRTCWLLLAVSTLGWCICFLLARASDRYPLHRAVSNRDIPEVRRLLDQGLSPNQLDDRGWLPIDHAFRWSKNVPVELLDLLLSHGADSNLKARSGWTPLHLAAASRDSTAYAYLIAHGADPSSKTDDGRTPRDLATFATHVWNSVRPTLVPHNEDVMDVVTRFK